MWELLTGDEPYADLHCASIIGKYQIVNGLCTLFNLVTLACLI